MKLNSYLAGSAYHLEYVLNHNLNKRALNDELTFLLLNQPPLCNYHCRRCFMPEERRGLQKNSLTLEDYKEIIPKAKRLGMKCIEISGEGEPLLSENLNGIIKLAYKNNFITTLITNGSQLTPEYIDFFYKNNVTLIISIFSLKKEKYESDNLSCGYFEKVIEMLKIASNIYKNDIKNFNNSIVYRLAVHTPMQLDNLEDLKIIKRFCDEYNIFFSVAPLAATGGGEKIKNLMITDEKANLLTKISHNSIILSKTSKEELGRRVCGTCFYGLNIGYDGSLLFDAHAGYEIGDILGNIRKYPMEELIRRQRIFIKEMFNNIKGFCPVRDKLWPNFLEKYLKNTHHFN